MKIRMKKSILISILTIAISAISFSFVNTKAAKASTSDTTVAAVTDSVDSNASAIAQIRDSLFHELRLEEKGLSIHALELAVKGYLELKETGLLQNPLLSIVDLSQSSRDKRFYLLDIEHKKLLENTYVAHGRNSGEDIATDFSNDIGSEKSSLGFYLTKETYKGKHGMSLKIEGLEQGFNDNAENRSIVVHGANYVNAARVQSNYMGRSQGCPALPTNEYKKIINEIKNGSALFIYSDNANYLNGSELLNS
jgi:L,D-transpeptidase catalytic domain